MPAKFYLKSQCLLFIGSLFFSSCTPKKKKPEATSEAAPVEFTQLHADLAAAQTRLRFKEDALELAKANSAESQAEIQEKTKQLTERDTRLTTLATELDNLKKQDSQVFRGIGELRQRGQFNSALNSYRMFMQDFPDSPLLPDAERAIAALTTRVETEEFESPTTATMTQTKRAQQGVKQRLAYGAVSAEELRPIIKNKTSREISSLLGNPDHVFPNGADWGYAERAIDERTGQKEMLIITFAAGKVSSFRLGYAGRKFLP